MQQSVHLLPQRRNTQDPIEAFEARTTTMYGKFSLIEIYLEQMTEDHSAVTVRYYRSVLMRAIESMPSLGSNPNGIGGFAVAVWLESLDVSKSSKNLYRGALSSYYSWCVRRGYSEENPAKNIPTDLKRPHNSKWRK